MLAVPLILSPGPATALCDNYYDRQNRGFERPFDLRIDTRGIELNVANRRNVYHWEQIEKVTVQRARGRFVRGIHVYPPSSRHPPKGIVALSFLRLEKMTD